MNRLYLFDSSAIIEILKGNEVVLEKYGNNPLVIINLVYGEVYYYCLRFGLKKERLAKINFQIVEFDTQDIEKAMELLAERKKQIGNFSFVDAVIYAVAQKNNLILVTKDFGFKGLPGVAMIIEDKLI